MRINLPTDLKTRTGAPNEKDARQKNSYIEVKGDQSIVRKRPSAQGGIPIGTGTAQGGIGININGTPYFIGFWADTMQAYTGGGVGIDGNWNSTTTYAIGDEVWIPDDENDPFEGGPPTPYYAQGPNTNKNPRTNPSYWQPTPAPATRFSGLGVEYVGGSNLPRQGDICATETAAVQSCFDLYTYRNCPGEAGNGYIWHEAPLGVTGAYPFRYGTFTQWHATGGICSNAVNDGAVSIITLTQIV